MFDFVHLLKNIRNCWLTEKTGELMFYDNGVEKIAKWQHLVTLYRLESNSLIKLSDLTETAVAPKPIERQKVSTCLRVFSEKTIHALLSHSGFEEKPDDTALFIKKVLDWWKILNVKGTGGDERYIIVSFYSIFLSSLNHFYSSYKSSVNLIL